MKFTVVSIISRKDRGGVLSSKALKTAGEGIMDNEVKLRADASSSGLQIVTNIQGSNLPTC
jgi:hypothetical protein